jgi:hypothetical protein
VDALGNIPFNICASATTNNRKLDGSWKDTRIVRIRWFLRNGGYRPVFGYPAFFNRHGLLSLDYVEVGLKHPGTQEIDIDDMHPPEALFIDPVPTSTALLRRPRVGHEPASERAVSDPCRSFRLSASPIPSNASLAPGESEIGCN